MSLIKCRECGKEISEMSTTCPNCGCPQNLQSKDTINKMNSFAIAGFSISIVSLFLNLWGLVGAIAVVLSGISLKQINKTNENGKGLAIAGLIIGMISVVYAIFIISFISSLF